MSSPCILKHKTIISSIPMCYAKYNNVNNFHFRKELTLKNSIMLTINGCDTLRPLGI